ncbi:MAG: TerD family protein [Clostridia bacterium]|nr:TerD family protein [Clostridia bacterium]
MAESKFVKTRCAKTGKYYGLECRQFGSTWKVVNFYDMSNEEASLVSSNLEQSSFQTNDNLLPCEKCGTRTVGGCNCYSGSHSCSSGMPYEFQCIYCKDLKIDNSEVEVSRDRIGEKIVLSQGQEVIIRGADNKPLKNIYVGVGWEASRSGPNIDVDSSVLVYSNSGNLLKLVYFGDKIYLDDCILHHGDNLYGSTGKRQDQDDENISVNLSRVPSDGQTLVFVINIYSCVDRHQDFSTINDLYIRLMDPDSKKTLIEYRMDQNFGRNTGLVVGTATRKGDGWAFKAIGEGVMVNTVQQFSSICTRYLPGRQ